MLSPAFQTALLSWAEVVVIPFLISIEAVAYVRFKNVKKQKNEFKSYFLLPDSDCNIRCIIL